MSEPTPWPARLAWIGAGVLLAGTGFLAAAGFSPELALTPTPRPAIRTADPVARGDAIEASPIECYLGVVLSNQAVDVVAEGEGRVLEMAVHVGDSVAEGQLLAVLESETLRHQLSIEQANLAAREAELKRITLEIERATQEHRRRLGLEDLISREEIATSKFQLDAARASLELAQAEQAQVQARLNQLDMQLARSEIRAPFDGTVALRYLDRGAVAGVGTPIVRLISSKGLMARFAVPPGEAAELSVGTGVRVEVESLGIALEGTIEHFMPEIDIASQQIFVEARLATPPIGFQALATGAVARVSLVRPGEPAGSCFGFVSTADRVAGRAELLLQESGFGPL